MKDTMKVMRTGLVAAFLFCGLAVQPVLAMEPTAENTVAKQGEVFPVVETPQVCMVTNRYFGTPQIPVQVEDQTYYGCCEMCKKNLTENESIRFAIDPYSGKEIDKAKAVIAALPNGGVLYFENRDNYESFRKANNL